MLLEIKTQEIDIEIVKTRIRLISAFSIPIIIVKRKQYIIVLSILVRKLKFVICTIFLTRKITYPKVKIIIPYIIIFLSIFVLLIINSIT